MILHRIISVMPSIASLKLFKYDKSLRLIKHILRSGDFLLEVNILFAEEYEIWGFRATFIVGIRLFCIKLTVTLWEVVQTLKKKVVAFIFNCALDEQTGKMSDILAIIDTKINVNLKKCRSLHNKLKLTRGLICMLIERMLTWELILRGC